MLSRDDSRSRGEEGAVPPAQRGTGDLPAQHLELVAQDRNLDILLSLAGSSVDKPESMGQQQIQNRQDHQAQMLRHRLRQRIGISAPFRVSPSSANLRRSR
jgi:hypothetical protein